MKLAFYFDAEPFGFHGTHKRITGLELGILTVLGFAIVEMLPSALGLLSGLAGEPLGMLAGLESGLSDLGIAAS
ncbi:MAG: hypothetical protein AAF590_02735 [Pseudomonadota bacterium]